MTPSTTGHCLAETDSSAAADRDSVPRRGAADASPFSLTLTDRSGRLTAADAAWLRDMARSAIAIARRVCAPVDTPYGSGGDTDGGEIRLSVVGDDEMACAHARFSGVPGTTDVLTFDLADGASARGAGFDADIVICLDEAARAAAERGVQPRDELLLYALHGALHCLGFDDHDEAAFAAMHALEDRVLVELGIGPLFGRPVGEGGTP